MDLVKLSNIFNSITQLLPGLNYYHCGIFEDINRNPENNFNVANSVGVLYPAVLFILQNGTFNLGTGTGRDYENVMTCNLVFYDLMHYGNDSLSDTRTIPEIFRDLHREAINFFAALKGAGRSLSAAPRGLFQVGQSTYEQLPYQHHERLACIRYEFPITFLDECETETIDLSTLPAPFIFPPAGWDYEDEGHQGDSV